ncbi:MAG: 4,5-dihydroxyphthalate decarboxylase [Rhodospirillales bacterium]|nr:4,5-dihydroxyphthalate decarboxylase [Rhodospirillales bacterium]
MSGLDLSIALERYDRHVPFFMGLVKPPEGLTLRPYEVGMAPPRRDGVDRHRRFLEDGEFDICETSLSSHIIATSRGAPFVGIPVFPRRLFSQNHFFVNVNAGIETPRDLIGKRVIIRTFQTTMSVLALGDLKFEYGVPLEEISWVVAADEVMKLGDRKGVQVRQVDMDADIGQMLIDGEADAMIHPHPPPKVLEAKDRVRPLFPDRRAEMLRYHGKNGYYPIMHVIAFKKALIDAEPWLAKAVMDMWNDASQQARAFYEDPGYSTLAFARNEFEEELETLGADPWKSGIAANRINLERFIGYSHDQRLIEQPIPVDSLFHESTWKS